MIAYKFLRPGGVGPFSRFAWPAPDNGTPGEWVESPAPLEMCRSGVHACRSKHLPYWINEELWVVELDGRSIEQGHVVVAERGRLVNRVERWDVEAAQAFAEACALRCCERAASLLVDAGRSREAEELSSAATTKERGVAAGGLRARFEGSVATALGYAADACYFALADPALTGFVTAHASAILAAGDGGDAQPFAMGAGAERQMQAAWLRDHLGLEH